jgi:glycosyltransferase 2 family protein
MAEPEQIPAPTGPKIAPWIRLLEAVAVIVILFLVIRTLWRQFALLDWNTLEISWHLALVSLAVATAAGLLMALVMAGYFKELGHPIGRGTAVVLATLPRLGRFIPGKIHSIVGIVWLAHRRDRIPARLSATAAVLVTLQFAVISIVCAAILTPFSDLPLPWTLLLIACGLLGMAGIHPWFSLGPVNWLLRRLGREPLPGRPAYARLLWLALIAALQRMIVAAMFVLLAASLLDLDPALSGHLAMAFILATFSGLIAFFAPGGIGVQEGALLLLLAPVLPPDQAALLTVAARIWQTVALLLDAGIGALVIAIKPGV